MNKLAFGLLLGSSLLVGCGSDSTEETALADTDTVKTSIDISGVSAIEVTLDSFDPTSGELEFSLKDADGLAILNASEYRIRYFGFPPQGEESANPKAWKLWHVVYTYQCDAETSCDDPIQARDGDGQYSFVPQNLYWNRDTAPGTTGRYRVAIEIYGNDVSNAVTLLAPTVE